MTAIPNIQLAAQRAISNTTANPATASAGVAANALGDTNASISYQTPFAGLLKDAIQRTQQLETNAATTVTGLLSGKGVDIHTAMIATEKSDLGFEMMLAFRNKAVSAYQQLMGLQF